MRTEKRTLDLHRIPRIQSLQFPPSSGKTAVMQLCELQASCPFRNCSCCLSLRDRNLSLARLGPGVASGWHAPLFKLTKSVSHANRDSTHDLHRLIDDTFT